MTLFCVIYCFPGSDIGVRQGGDLADGTSQFTHFFIGLLEDEQGNAVAFSYTIFPRRRSAERLGMIFIELL